MAKKTEESKIILEREYIIPLRKEWLKVPEYKRANKAAKAIRQFLVRHMKVYDRDLKKIKIDILLNNELRFRGMKKPPAKIKVKAKKFNDEIVRVELAEIPKIIQYKLDREKKIKEKIKKKEIKKIEKKPEEKTEEETKQEAKEKSEKKESVKEAGLKEAKKQHKAIKHEAKIERVKKPLARKALAK